MSAFCVLVKLKANLNITRNMPRRRKIEIKASELACFDTLVEELRTRPEFADFDPASLRVWAYESHEQELKNVDKAICHLDCWLYIREDKNKLPAFDSGRLMNKKELAAALGITRPTLYRWLSSKWFEGCRDERMSRDEYYSSSAVREALQRYLARGQNE